MKLSKEEFELVVRHTPLVSIDFVIKNHENQCLLGLRKNAPAAGFWFNLGGRIYKNEIIDEALDRIFEDETGGKLNRNTLKLIGVFDHIYDENVFLIPNFGTHYICMAYELIINGNSLPKANDQHSFYEWRNISNILSSDDVHENTKICFRK